MLSPQEILKADPEGRGPTGEGRWFALVPDDGVVELEVRKHVDGHLVWTWSDDPGATEEAWHTGWPAARAA